MRKSLLLAVLMLANLVALRAQSEFAPETLLKPRITGPYSIAPNLDARTGYDMLGDRAGINMVYSLGFKPETVVPVRIEGPNFFTVMDKYSAETGNFWFAWDSKTVIVAPDTQASRRDLEPMTFKILYLDSSTRDEDLLRIANTLRTNLRVPGLYPGTSAKAIAMYGPPSALAAAESMILQLQTLPLSSSAPLRFPTVFGTVVSIAESGTTRRVVPATQAHLEKVLVDSVSINMSESPGAIFENLALQGGINVIVDRSVRDKPASRFHVERVSLINALDLLALQSQTFWQPINDSTIQVMDNTQQNRRDREAMQVKIIYLPDMATTTTVNETVNILRTALSMRGLYQNEAQKAIVIRDTPLRLFVAEKTIADLTRMFGKTTSVGFTMTAGSLYSEGGWQLSNAANARPQLEVKLRSRTTIRLNDTPKKNFEALADLAGLKLSEKSVISQAAATPLNLYNVDILDAIDLLSWQTRHFWQVEDEHTIRIVPDTVQMRRDLEPMVERTIYPTSATQPAATALLNLLRTAFALRQIQLNEKNGFVIRDTAENVAMAEKLIEILGTEAKP